MKTKIKNKIDELEKKVALAITPPITGTIYHIEKWEAQIDVLKDLLR